MSNVQTTLEKMRARQGQLGGGPVPPPPTPPANGQAEPRRAGPKGKGRRFPEFRLPHGAVFEAKYDAEAQRWAASLTVPGLPPYRTISGGVHQALIYLGRRWYEEHGATAQAEPPA